MKQMASTGSESAAKKKSASNQPANIDTHQIIVVRSGFNGQLVYISPKTGEKFVWENFGDEQEMELGEIRNAKSSAKSFFINNWFMFDDEYEWVIDYIGVRQYYENAISLDEFDTIFTNSPDEIASKISKMTAGQKQSLSYKARKMIVEGKIDSRKAIAALEQALGISLVEK